MLFIRKKKQEKIDLVRLFGSTDAAINFWWDWIYKKEGNYGRK